MLTTLCRKIDAVQEPPESRCSNINIYRCVFCMHMPQRKLFFVKMFRVNAISYANRQYITVMVDGGGEGGVKKKKKKGPSCYTVALRSVSLSVSVPRLYFTVILS